MLKHLGQISRALCGRSFAPRPDARLPLHDGPLFLTHGHEREAILLAALPGRAEAVVRKLPSPFAPTPVLPCGLRATLPSALNTIVKLVFEGVKDVNGTPLKNSAWISFGDSRLAASEPLVVARNRAAANTLIEARIASPPKFISRESYVAAVKSAN